MRQSLFKGLLLVWKRVKVLGISIINCACYILFHLYVIILSSLYPVRHWFEKVLHR